MQSTHSIHTKLTLCFVLLSLISVVFVALSMPARSCLRWSVFSADEVLRFRYVLRVDSPMATLIFSEDDESVILTRQNIVQTNGSNYLIAEGHYSPDLAKGHRLRLYTLDWLTLTASTTHPVSLQEFPTSDEIYTYQYFNEKVGFVLQTDQAVTDLSDNIEPLQKIPAITFISLALIALFEVFFLLSIFLLQNRSSYTPKLSSMLHTLKNTVPLQLQQAGRKKYRIAYGEITTLSLLFRFSMFWLLLSNLLRKPQVQIWLIIISFILALLAPLTCILLRAKLVLPINSCKLNETKSTLCATAEPEFELFFRFGYSTKKYLRDFTMLSYLVLTLQLEGKLDQALELLDSSYQEESILFFRTNEAQYHALRCQLYLDMENYNLATEEIICLEQALRRFPKPPLGEYRIYRSLQHRYLLMLAMVEGRWTDALPIASALRNQAGTIPLAQVRVCGFQYRIALALGDNELSQNCLAVIQRYAPGYANYLTDQ